jgi:prepilin-type N-terminal cleavage/methylation domain-containing protein
MRRPIFREECGFTLIEVLIVLVMFGIVMGALSSLFLTHQKTACTQDEVAEVQQNLRIALDSIARDIQMAGFLIPFADDAGTVENRENLPIGVARNNTGLPAADPSDAMTLNTASATGIHARITVPRTGEGVFAVDSPESVDAFHVDDMVRIIRPANREQPGGTSAVFKVTRTDRDGTPPILTLSIQSGMASGALFAEGDIIFKTAVSAPHPNTVTYCIGPDDTDGGCGKGITTCPAGQLCLIRIENGIAGVIAQNMAGLQFRYLLDDRTEVDIPTNPGAIRAVRVTIACRTAATAKLSGGAKMRSITSVVNLRNR